MNPLPRPNVILVMTDDQGYGDLGCTGHPFIKTPAIDAFHDDAIRLTDFHVQPLCTPTRGALMTGRRPVRNGAWATCWGRSILRPNETTMADVFRASGYRTGLFGKWHLGDNYPFRPFDRGFERTVAHHGGGVGQTPDFWGNNYFDDTYFHNGQARAHTGYCTDVWFEQAMDFIDDPRTGTEKPFFAYIATNAPHSPYFVGEEYRAMYEGTDGLHNPPYCGMVTNIDDNFARLRTFLQERGVEENTLLIFMTDNGSDGGVGIDPDGFVTHGHNSGMRGKKGSYYEGGHRVPCFMRWSGGGLAGGVDRTGMTLDIDILPTLMNLCALEEPVHAPFDGIDIAPLVRGEMENLPDRVNFLNIVQSSEPPRKETGVVMTERWRLVHGKELYDIKTDPGQRDDIATDHPEVVKRLLDELDAWWAEVEPEFNDVCRIVLGNDAENPVKLTAMDVMGDVVWHQKAIVEAQRSTGSWNVEMECPGRYRFRLRRWPEELPIAMEETVSAECAERVIYGPAERLKMIPIGARLGLFSDSWTRQTTPGSEEVVFDVDIEHSGPTVLDAWFDLPDGDVCGAYYVYVERVGNERAEHRGCAP